MDLRANEGNVLLTPQLQTVGAVWLEIDAGRVEDAHSVSDKGPALVPCLSNRDNQEIPRGMVINKMFNRLLPNTWQYR